MQIANDEDVGVLRVIGALSIGEVVELQETLCRALAERPNLVVDLSGVDSCDTAALQLLYAARQTVGSARQVQFTQSSGAIAETAAALGFDVTELMAESAASSASPDSVTTSGI